MQLKIALFFCLPFGLLSQAWTITLGTSGPTSLAYGGTEYAGSQAGIFPVSYYLGSGSTCPTLAISNLQPTGVVSGSTVTYTTAKLTLAETYTDQGSGVLHIVFLWTNNDAVDTICSVSTSLNLIIPSPGFTAAGAGNQIGYDYYPANIVNGGSSSLAVWSDQTYTKQGVYLNWNAWNAGTGAQLLGIGNSYSTGIAIYSAQTTWANPIPPLGTFQVDVYLAVGAANATLASLAYPAVVAQQAALPAYRYPASREAMCEWFMAGNGNVSATNPRGYNLGSGTPTALQALVPSAFQTAFSYTLAKVVANAQLGHCQDVHIWDSEGDGIPGWEFIGHPSIGNQMAPEMYNPAFSLAGIAPIDQAVAALKAVGIGVGFTLRPQKLLASNGPPATCTSANAINPTAVGKGTCVEPDPAGCAGNSLLCTCWQAGATYPAAGGQTVISFDPGGSIYGGRSTTGNTANGSNLISVANSTGVNNGMGVQGTGIPANTTVLDKTGNGGVCCLLSANATADGTGGSIQFGNYSVFVSLPTVIANLNQPPWDSSTYWFNVDSFNDTVVDASRINVYPPDETSNLNCVYTNTWATGGQGQIMQTQQRSLAAVQAVLQHEITYAWNRWGNGVHFYADSTVYTKPYDSTVLWKALANANPGVVISPEEINMSGYAYVVAYNTTNHVNNPGNPRPFNPIYAGYTTMTTQAYASATTYAAGTVVYCGGACTANGLNYISLVSGNHANDPPSTTTGTACSGGPCWALDTSDALSIAEGNLPGPSNLWFQNAIVLQQSSNRNAACAINAAMTITDTNTSTTHTYYGDPCSILPYPVVMRVYYADTAGDLPASTTYCEMRGMPQCYQAGIWTGGATVNLLGLPASELRYYDFAGNYAGAPGTQINMGIFNGTLGAVAH